MFDGAAASLPFSGFLLLRFKARRPVVGRVGEGGRRVAESVKAD
jgi:hypothetical protein